MFKNKCVLLSITLLLLFNQFKVYADVPKSNLTAELNFDVYQPNVVSESQNGKIKIMFCGDFIKTIDVKSGKIINIKMLSNENSGLRNGSVVYDGKRFINITGNGEIFETLDGINWSDSGNFFDLTGEKYDKDRDRLGVLYLEFYKGTYYISAGDEGVYKSDDMKTFKHLNMPKDDCCEYVFKTIRTKSKLLSFWGDGEPKETFSVMISRDEKKWNMMGQTFCAQPISVKEFKNHIYVVSDYSNVNIDGKSYYQKGLTYSLSDFYIEGDKIYGVDVSNRLYSFKVKEKYLDFKYVKTSKDNLVKQQNNFTQYMPLNKVIYNGKRYIAFYQNNIQYENQKGFYYYTSADNKTWKKLRLPIDTVVDLDSGDDRTIFISKDINKKGNKYVLSILKDNKIKKVAIPIPQKYKNMSYNNDDNCGVKYSNNKFILWISLRKDKNGYGTKELNTLIFTSGDGLKWKFESCIENFEGHNFYKDNNTIIFNGFYNNKNSILFSNDMKKWQKVNIPLRNDSQATIGKINEKYICFIGNSLFESSNAITWKHIKDINFKDYNILGYTAYKSFIVSNHIFFITDNKLYTTTDFNDISRIDGYNIDNINCLLKVSDGYVGVGDSSCIYTIKER